MDGIPRGLIVAVVLVLGVAAVFIARPPHRQCESQIDVLRSLQRGRIFGAMGKSMARSPLVLKNIETCKLGNSPGACFELFSTMRGLSRDLSGIPLECAEDVRGVGEVRASLRETLTLLVQIAWGEQPPEQGVGSVRQGWLESSDLALFCNLKDLYTRFFGKEEMDQIRNGIFSKLPGEAAVFNGGVCVNCEFRKTAPQVLAPEEIWSRTLFSVRCDLYR